MAGKNKVMFSVNPTTGVVEAYDKNGVFIGTVSTLGDSISELDKYKPKKSRKKKDEDK